MKDRMQSVELRENENRENEKSKSPFDAIQGVYERCPKDIPCTTKCSFSHVKSEHSRLFCSKFAVNTHIWYTICWFRIVLIALRSCTHSAHSTHSDFTFNHNSVWKKKIDDNIPCDLYSKLKILIRFVLNSSNLTWRFFYISAFSIHDWILESLVKTEKRRTIALRKSEDLNYLTFFPPFFVELSSVINPWQYSYLSDSWTWTPDYGYRGCIRLSSDCGSRSALRWIII